MYKLELLKRISIRIVLWFFIPILSHFLLTYSSCLHSLNGHFKIRLQTALSQKFPYKVVLLCLYKTPLRLCSHFCNSWGVWGFYSTFCQCSKGFHHSHSDKKFTWSNNKKNYYCVNFRLERSKAPLVIMGIIKTINDCPDQSFTLCKGDWNCLHVAFRFAYLIKLNDIRGIFSTSKIRQRDTGNLGLCVL